MIFFILLFLAIVIPMGFYLYFYLKRTLLFWFKERKWIKKSCIILAIVLAALSINMFGTSALIVLHIVAISFLMELINVIIKKIKWKRKPEHLWKKIYGSGILPVVVTAVVLVFGAIHIQDIHKKEYTVTTAKQIQQGGYKVLMLSDLHFGTTMGEEKLQKVCDEMNTTQPDFIILDGDIVDEKTTQQEMQTAVRLLGQLESNYGIYYVFGNHDKATYSFRSPFNEKELREELTANGIHVLEDETVLINNEITLIGRQDRSSATGGSRVAMSELLGSVNKESFLFVLDHQPVELKENAEAKIDFQMSGHTHGGQIWPIGLIIDVLGFGEMNYGYRKIDDYQVIVSSGIAGWGYSIRTGSDSEYVVVQINSR